MERTKVAVIGAGQAGLSASYHLAHHEVDHVVLERNRVADSWHRGRWDSFRLVTQNWQWRLPGPPQLAAEPEAFMTRADVIGGLEQLAGALDTPLRTGVTISSVEPGSPHGFQIETSAGALAADAVVVATGTYHHAAIPALAGRLDPSIQQLHSSAYRNPAALPPGAVLVVGSGQSGWQIAREIHQAGRQVHWSLGRASRLPRRYRGRDIFRWMKELGLLDLPMGDHPAGPRIRHEPKPFICPSPSDEPEDPRRLAQEGLVLHGRLESVNAGKARFGGDMRRNLREADDACLGMATLIDTFIEHSSATASPPAKLITHFDPPEPARDLNLRGEGIGTIIWATGYRSDWQSWLKAGAFDRRGYPLQDRGVSPHLGLYFAGLDWMHTWGSGLLYGVADDAAHVVEQLLSA